MQPRITIHMLMYFPPSLIPRFAKILLIVILYSIIALYSIAIWSYFVKSDKSRLKIRSENTMLFRQIYDNLKKSGGGTIIIQQPSLVNHDVISQKISTSSRDNISIELCKRITFIFFNGDRTFVDFR